MKLPIIASLLASAAAFAPASHSIASSRPASQLAVAIDTSDIKNGLTVEIDGEPWKVLHFSIMKQARGAAKTTIQFKNLKKGNTLENTYRSGEKFETAMIEKKPAQYTYPDENDNLFFMDMETFEETMVEAKVVEDVEKWIDEGMEVNLVYFKGEVIEVVVPQTMSYTIAETEPGIKGNTAQGVTKPAILSCGATITVPGYLSEGEAIKVDTNKGEFLSRDNE